MSAVSVFTVHFTVLHLTGTQEGQEEAAAGRGWILQCVLHVRAEPDPGVQGGKVHPIASRALRRALGENKVLYGKGDYSERLFGSFGLLVSCDLGGNVSKPPRTDQPA